MSLCIRGAFPPQAARKLEERRAHQRKQKTLTIISAVRFKRTADFFRPIAHT